ncbi:MAG: hypothetical protein QXJ74_03365 [Nitrososphaera sp.]|uniref:hypothetical protein n=1 Tax=Nitrososphaera sp. TaxID=1971748 RepID=UPI0025F8ED9E|nr:hypothetical protein [Nitrososphaera sp.]
MRLVAELMNIVYSPSGLVTAKTCGCTDRKQVTYAFSAEPHSLCLDKKDVLEAQISACERLLKYTKDASEKSTVEKEISELKMALDLMT